METKRVEVKSLKTVYVAVDGTEFNDEKECLKYEDSTVCVLKSRIREFTKKVTNCDLAFGEDADHECWIISPRNSEDVKSVRQLMAVYGNTHSEVLESQIGKIVYLIWNYEKDYAWVRTLESIVEYATSGSESGELMPG